MSIIEEMNVLAEIDCEVEIERRIKFIQDQVRQAGAKTLVLGISGGVDSFVCGRLAQLAAEGLRDSSDMYDVHFLALRLPYNTQADEEDAQLSLLCMHPDQRVEINIGKATDAIDFAVTNPFLEGFFPPSKELRDFVKGNSKARMRMLAQYHVAGLTNGLVLGTDHSAENITGFYTKFGDGACDLAPLFGLSKRQVRQLAKALGAVKEIYNKPATADLECLDPQKSDESVLGMSYEDIDNYLEGKHVEPAVEAKIIKQYNKTQHKRLPIPTPSKGSYKIRPN